jgi:hypothetical protein
MSKGVFRIIGGRGVFVTALFEETFLLRDFWILDESMLVFGEAIGLSEVFNGFIPARAVAQATEVFSANDVAIQPDNPGIFEEGFGMRDMQFVLTPSVYRGSGSEMSGMYDEFAIPAKIESQNTLLMGDFFECRIESKS